MFRNYLLGLCAVCSISAFADTFPYHESFESGMGRWLTSSLDGVSWSWDRHTGSTWSYNTGPTGAHDRDYYVYVESSGSAIGAKRFTMTGTFDLSSLSNPVLAFRYSMYGATMGTLIVQIDDGSGWANVLTLSGQQTASAEDWELAKLDLSSYISSSTKIRFHATTGSSFTSDFCVDDIWIFEEVITPYAFDFGPIDERQVMGDSFPVTITAVNSIGNRMSSFNESVELTAWTDGYNDACQNRDFNGGTLAYWDEYDSVVFPGPYQITDSIFGDGKAAAFRPGVAFDGLQQDITVRGGERYYVSAKFCFENKSDTATYSGFYQAKILVDGMLEDQSYTYTTLYDDYQLGITLWGYFDVPEEDDGNTVTVAIVGKSGMNENPDVWAYIDDVSVNFAAAGYLSPVPGITPKFTNGQWSGNVTMNYRLPAMNLLARYHDTVGESGEFSTYVSAFDLDGDGLLDSWETQYFSSRDLCDPDEDTDGDGYTNLDEFVIGTHPKQLESCLQLQSTADSDGACIITWQTATGRSYDVEWTPNLLYTAFSDIAVNLSDASGAFTNVTDGAATGYYRLKVHKR